MQTLMEKGPFKRQNYIEKFKTLTDGLIKETESKRFLKQVQDLHKLKKGEFTN